MAAAWETNPVERYYKRFRLLEAERRSWDSHWKELSDYLMPISGRFLTGDTQPNQGTKLNDNILDGTATLASGILAAGMHGGLTSPARPWFRMRTGVPQLMEAKDVRVWLDSARDIMLEVFSRSNFYDSIFMVYQELGVFGTAVMLVEEDFENVIRCRVFTIGEYYLALNKHQRVDTLYRLFWATAGQLVSRFGRENCSDSVVRMVENRQNDQWVKCVHAIEPRDDFNADKGAKGMPWKSVYFEWGRDRNKLLGESGYEEFPAIALRWSMTGGDIYGRGPGMDALGDVKMLQELQKKSLIAIGKMVDPPLNAPGNMKGTDIVTQRAGEVNFVPMGQGQQGVTPAVQVNFPVDKVEMKIAQTAQKIGRYFYNELFLTPEFGDGKNRTATEVSAIQQEKMLRLGAIMGRIQSEGLDPLIDRVFNICNRAGIFPPPPLALNGVDLKIEYIDLLAQAQKLVNTTAIERLATFAANLMPVFPEVRHKFDAQEAVDQYGESVGTPASVIRDDKEAAARQQAEAQQMANAQALANIQQATEATKNLADTPVGGAEQNMLDRLMGGSQQGAV